MRSLTESGKYAEGRAKALNEEATSLKQRLRSEQQARKGLQDRLDTLIQIANLDLGVLKEEATLEAQAREKVHEKLGKDPIDSPPLSPSPNHVSRWKERDNAVQAAKSLDAEYTAKFNAQRGKLQEFRERARKVMDEKDVSIKARHPVPPKARGA